mmetsp:Transcript_17525/g.24377  ORF Transcript_17525/g.24377 Transcript_17525/m.24377 type:complete len:124 (+) Transcript_17525:1462-1833(+)
MRKLMGMSWLRREVDSQIAEELSFLSEDPTKYCCWRVLSEGDERFELPFAFDKKSQSLILKLQSTFALPKVHELNVFHAPPVESPFEVLRKQVQHKEATYQGCTKDILFGLLTGKNIKFRRGE